MLSDTAEYALRAVLYVAQHDDQGPVRAEEVAKALSVPRNYLSKMLHVLAREGVLSSTLRSVSTFFRSTTVGDLIREGGDLSGAPVASSSKG